MRVLIVEDEPLVARRLARMLQSIRDADLEQLDTAPTLEAARDALASGRYDVLFLDLNLRGRNGFELLASAVAGAHQTIVVSANTDRAVEAFDFGVVDFVPKPFSAARLNKALSRLEDGHPPVHRRLCFLSFRRGDGIEVVEVDLVRAIHGADNYAEVELIDGRRLLHDKTLERLESLLPETFERIHRSHIANLRCISRVRSLPGSRYRAILDSGDELPVSRERVKRLRSRLL